METLSSNKRIIKNTAFLYVRMIFVTVVTLYTSRLVLEVLGVEDYGLYNVVGGIVLLFMMINNALSSGTSRFITYELGRGDSNRMQKTFSASFAIHFFIAIIVLLLSETIGLWYINNILVIPSGREYAANWLFQFSVITCMFSLTQVPYTAAIIAHEKMSVYAWVGIVEAGFKLIMVMFLYYLDNFDKLIVYGAILMIWSISIQLFYRFYCTRHFQECKIVVVKDREYYSKMLSFSLWDIIGSLCTTGYNQGLGLLINYFFGVIINAALGVATQVQTAVSQFTNNFITAVKPQIVKLYAEGNIQRMRNLVFESSRVSFYLLLMVSLPLILECDYVISLWLKEVPEKSIVFVQLILISSIIRGFANPIVLAVHATGNIKRLNLLCGGTSLLINLPGSYIAYLLGAPAEASFLILIVSSIIGNLLELNCLCKVLEFDAVSYIKEVYLKGILISIITFCSCIAVHLFLNEGFVRLLCCIFVSVFVTSICAYCFGVSSQLRVEIKSGLSKFIKR